MVTGQQDYTFNIQDFAYLEKISLLSADGNTSFEITDIHNANILGLSAPNNPSNVAQPNAAAVKFYNPGTNVSLRFLPIPDQAYTGIVTYQKLPIPFQIFSFESVEVISGVAFYTFSATQNFPPNFLVGQDMQVQGFDLSVNNGTFPLWHLTNNYFILANPNAVTDVAAATGINIDWFPIPDHFSEIYNNLFLAEALANVDDAREQVYRQRGIAALLSKAEGLNDMQVNTFLAQAFARSTGQEMSSQMKRTQGGQGRGI